MEQSSFSASTQSKSDRTDRTFREGKYTLVYFPSFCFWVLCATTLAMIFEGFDASVIESHLAAGAGTVVEFTLPCPSAETYSLPTLRTLCERHGLTRFRAQIVAGAVSLHVTVDTTRLAVPPLVALSMLVRDDTAGFERAMLTALSQVDEIVVSVDGRSRPETLAMAHAYADTVVVFGAADIEATEEEWLADRIHFAHARNISRKRVRAPWAFVVDADEVVRVAEGFDMREFLQTLDASYGAVSIAMGAGEFSHRDPQRLARSAFLYSSSMHNQLPIQGKRAEFANTQLHIAHDVSLRPVSDNERRKRQRDVGIEDLVREGRKGDLPALFHAAKHFMGYLNAERGVPLVEYYRLRTEIHGAYSVERIWLALSVAAFYLHAPGEVDLRKAEQWAVRALLDGPRLEAFTMLGDIAEEEGDLHRARLWYECACAIEADMTKFTIHEDVARRFDRRDDLRRKLFNLRTAGADNVDKT